MSTFIAAIITGEFQISIHPLGGSKLERQTTLELYNSRFDILIDCHDGFAQVRQINKTIPVVFCFKKQFTVI